jgi:hypothetical protein
VIPVRDGWAAARGGSAPFGAGRSETPPEYSVSGVKSRPDDAGRMGIGPDRGVTGRDVAGPDAPRPGVIVRGTAGGLSAGSPTRDLQLAQVTNFAPVGRSATLTRLMFPHAVQAASIIGPIITCGPAVRRPRARRSASYLPCPDARRRRRSGSCRGGAAADPRRWRRVCAGVRIFRSSAGRRASTLQEPFGSRSLVDRAATPARVDPDEDGPAACQRARARGTVRRQLRSIIKKRKTMLDPARMDDACRRGGDVATAVAAFRSLDERRKELQGKLDRLREERNKANDRMAKLDKKSPDFVAARDELKGKGGQIKEGEAELQAVEAAREALQLGLPNAPHASVPDGAGEADNQVVHTWGEKPRFDFPPQAHWDLGARLGILDFDAGARITGARFTVLRGAASRLTRALVSYMLDLHTAHGYEEMWPPAVVRRASLRGTGQLP